MTVSQRGIEAVIAQTLLAVLTKWCITDVPTTDESRANSVILGKPTQELRDAIVVSIHMQHPLGLGADKDAIVSGPPKAQSDRSWTWPAEIGAGRTEKIIGVVQLNIRERQPYGEAVETIASVVERVKAAINRDPALRALSDDFGNTVMQIETFQAEGYAGGGGQVSTNFRWIDWRAFVYRTQDCRT